MFILPLTNLNQSLQLVELAVKIFKVVLVQGSEAVHIHDFDQHTEGLFLWHLKAQGETRQPLETQIQPAESLAVNLFQQTKCQGLNREREFTKSKENLRNYLF